MKSEKTLKVVYNPAIEEAFAQGATCSVQQVFQVPENAQEAWPTWRKSTGLKRREYLLKIAAELEENRDKIAKTISLENGKPLTRSNVEVLVTVDQPISLWRIERKRLGKKVRHERPLCLSWNEAYINR